LWLNFFDTMPFSSNRNSREDTSKRKRSTPGGSGENKSGSKRPSFNSSKDQNRDPKFGKSDRDSNFGGQNRDSKFEKPNRDSKFERPSRDSKFERPSRDSKFERPSGDSKFERPNRDSKFERPNRDSKFERPSGDSKFERPNRDSKFERPNRDSKFERPSRDSKFERPSRDSKFERPSRDSKFERPSRDSKFERPSRDSSFERPNRDSKFPRPSRDTKFGKPGYEKNQTFKSRGFSKNESDDKSEKNSNADFRKPYSDKKQKTSKEDDGLIRLNRYIANSGVCSRRKADELIEAGVVTVNGEPVTELGIKVDPAKDEIRYNNERLKREKMVYVLLNKPKDYITTTDDPQERKTVMHLVANSTKERIYPVGRLDRNTTGLLLLTNDGNLAEKLSHPRNNVSKIYQVELNKNLTQGDFNKINFGVELEDGVVKPDDLSYVMGASKREVGIQIHSGKNRVVRRIFESLGYDVIKLDRVVYSCLTKKDLPRGRWRYLEEKEIIQLKHLIK